MTLTSHATGSASRLPRPSRPLTNAPWDKLAHRFRSIIVSLTNEPGHRRRDLLYVPLFVLLASRTSAQSLKRDRDSVRVSLPSWSVSRLEDLPDLAGVAEDL